MKTNRRDAVGLAKLLRAGELTPAWVPDEGHEAMRDLIRARAAAVETQRVHRQLVKAFMLKHGRILPRKRPAVIGPSSPSDETLVVRRPRRRRRSFPSAVELEIDGVAVPTGADLRSAGQQLNRSTLADWVGRAAWYLRPLHDRTLEEMRRSQRLFADDTTRPVLDAGRKRTKTG